MENYEIGEKLIMQPSLYSKLLPEGENVTVIGYEAYLVKDSKGVEWMVCKNEVRREN